MQLLAEPNPSTMPAGLPESWLLSTSSKLTHSQHRNQTHWMLQRNSARQMPGMNMAEELCNTRAGQREEALCYSIHRAIKDQYSTVLIQQYECASSEERQRCVHPRTHSGSTETVYWTSEKTMETSKTFIHGKNKEQQSHDLTEICLEIFVSDGKWRSCTYITSQQKEHTFQVNKELPLTVSLHIRTNNLNMAQGERFIA